MNAPQENTDFRAMTAQTVGRDLLQGVVMELKLLPDVWPKLSESKQNDVIDRLRARVERLVGMAVHVLASEGRVVVAGDLDQITIKDGVKAVVKFGQAAPNLHQLYEYAGQAVLVVVADAKSAAAGMDEVRGESDQRGLDLGHEYQENDGGGMDGQVVEGEALALPAPSDMNSAPRPAVKATGALPNEHGVYDDKDAERFAWEKGKHSIEVHVLETVDGWIYATKHEKKGASSAMSPLMAKRMYPDLVTLASIIVDDLDAILDKWRADLNQKATDDLCDWIAETEQDIRALNDVAEG